MTDDNDSPDDIEEKRLPRKRRVNKAAITPIKGYIPPKYNSVARERFKKHGEWDEEDFFSRMKELQSLGFSGVKNRVYQKDLCSRCQVNKIESILTYCYPCAYQWRKENELEKEMREINGMSEAQKELKRMFNNALDIYSDMDTVISKTTDSYKPGGVLVTNIIIRKKAKMLKDLFARITSHILLMNKLTRKYSKEKKEKRKMEINHDEG